ncbi:MAG TPA: RluA family pseudouridine synthase [Saprospiraceae bacterium]|nr:RluA family pseudouridine synthase [Saprospiraceae bacterium]
MKKDEQPHDWISERVFIVDPKQTPVRIDKFIQERTTNISRNKIQRAIRDALISVNDATVPVNYKVRPNDKIVMALMKPLNPDYTVSPEDIPIQIIYEDEDVMVVNKEAGMVVHPGIGNPSGTLVNALAGYFRDKELPVKQGNDADRPGLVHRIDKQTSGLLVIAKTEQAMTHLSKQFVDHSIERKYYALVWGDVEDDAGTIESFIGRNPKNRTERIVVEEEYQGKWAVTHYKVIKRFYYVTLVECQLETGRTHQIRVHMKSLGHPLFSDSKYGGDRIRKGTVFTRYKQFVENCFKLMSRQALHAKTLGFEHPVTGEHMHFDSDLPDDFAQVLDKWDHYLSHRKDVLGEE